MITVSLKDVSKFYHGREALAKVSLKIDGSGIFCILGPNGSGKTTILKIVLGLIAPSTGEVVWQKDGSPLKKIDLLAFTGSLLEAPQFRSGIKSYQLLRLSCEMKGISDVQGEISRVSELSRISQLLDREISTLSQGMLQRLLIANSFIGNPDLMILDEPTYGLDPESYDVTTGAIMKMRNEGKTILMTTHNLWEAENLSDFACIIVNPFNQQWIQPQTKGYAYLTLENKDLDKIKDLKYVRLAMQRKNICTVAITAEEFYNNFTSCSGIIKGYTFGSDLPLKYFQNYGPKLFKTQ